jgi:hypothetical protein
MQTLRSAVVPLLLAVACAPLSAAPPKTHTVNLGPPRKVPYTPPEANPADKSEDSTTLRVRPLVVDGLQKEWTVGEVHDVTDRSFVIRRALRLNDSLPAEPPRWTWQPGPWMLVDRITGHITALHLPDYDTQVSVVVWFRDYAAYCGLSVGGKQLYAVVAQIAGRRPLLMKKLAGWDPANHPASACAPAAWQREPLKVTFLLANGAPAVSYELVGLSAVLVEEGDDAEE